MTDLESMAARVDRIERQLRATRAASACAVIIAVALGVGSACTHHEHIRTAPPTKIELRSSSGGPTVTIDPTGIVLKNGTSTTWLDGEGISARSGQQRAILSAKSLEFPGAAGNTTLQHDTLSMEHGEHTITATVAQEKATMILSSDGLRRAVELIAGKYYASVESVLLPPDGISPPHAGQLAADKDGAELTVSDGKTERSLSQKVAGSSGGRR